MFFDSIEDYVSANSPCDETGSTIYEHEIRRALNHALAHRCIEHALSAGFKIETCPRVLYSSQTNWIDVIIILSNEVRDKKKFIITYESDTDKFIACAEAHGNLRVLDTSAHSLPFALATRSYADTVYATDEQMLELNTRRQMFMKALVAALAPMMGVSPAMAATTPYTTNSNTQSTKNQQTTYGTSGVTTPGDNDTRNDTKTDTVTDNKTDTTPDTRNDP